MESCVGRIGEKERRSWEKSRESFGARCSSSSSSFSISVRAHIWMCAAAVFFFRFEAELREVIVEQTARVYA